MDRACSMHGREEECIRGMVETRRKEPLGRPRRRWENNIKIDLREIGWDYGLSSSGSEWRPVAAS
jgi:hypothetical protein